MGSPTLRQLVLAELAKGLPGISPAMGQFLAEASAVSLERQRHPQGVHLTVSGISPSGFAIHWPQPVSQQLFDTWDDEQECTEYGACGVAILLILDLTAYTVIRRARKGQGVDYWLGHKDAVQPFQEAARLEVSGILSGDDAAIQARTRAKLRQTAPTDGPLPAYVVVVEFGSPASRMVRK
jgi:hypothetical protein